jgi:hypothetical protein
MYQLIIHHDIGVIDKNGKLEKEPTGLGHVYFVSSILQHSMPSADDMKWAENIAKATKNNLQNNLPSMENMNFLPSFDLPNTSDQGTANYLNNIFESFNVQNKSMDFMGKHDEHSDSD